MCLCTILKLNRQLSIFHQGNVKLGNGYWESMFPKDVIEDLKGITPQIGFSGYQPLIRAYIGQGLRQDLARLEGQLNVEKFINSLRKHGVDETTIDEAISDHNGNCGNISAAVGPYVIDQGLIVAKGPITKVRILQKNTNNLIIAEVPVKKWRL